MVYSTDGWNYINSLEFIHYIPSCTISSTKYTYHSQNINNACLGFFRLVLVCYKADVMKPSPLHTQCMDMPCWYIQLVMKEHMSSLVPSISNPPDFYRLQYEKLGLERLGKRQSYLAHVLPQVHSVHHSGYHHSEQHTLCSCSSDQFPA